MSKKMTDKARQPRDVDELLRLYHAWFAVLLRCLGEGEHRITQADIAAALSENRITVRKEERDYVVCLAEAEPNGKETTYGENI